MPSWRLSFLLLAMVSSSLHAGTISLETQIRTSVHGEKFQMDVSATNKGTESAYNVQFKTEAAAASVGESPVQQMLPVGKSYSYSFHHTFKDLTPGRYFCVVRAMYADTNLYPFSALSLASFVYKNDAAASVLGVLEAVEIQTHGRMKLKLKNIAGAEQALTVRLLLPQELSVDQASIPVKLLPFEEKSLSIDIRNFSALGGSTYPIYALLEYDRDGLHYSSAAMGMVRIGAAGVTPNFLDRFLMPLVLLLVAGIVFLNVRAFWNKK